MSRTLVSLIERGHIEHVAVGTLQRIGYALDMRVDLLARWRGGDLDRLLNARHSAFHEQLARHLRAINGWEFGPEVSFAVYGERGWIDIMAWHPVRRALLVVELKTDVVDVQETVGTLDRKRRLARRIAAERGWHALSVSVWLVIAESRANRARVTAHATMLRAAFPADGRTVKGWLRDPGRPIAAMSFWRNSNGGDAMASLTAPKRVRIAVRRRC